MTNLPHLGQENIYTPPENPENQGFMPNPEKPIVERVDTQINHLLPVQAPVIHKIEEVRVPAPSVDTSVPPVEHNFTLDTLLSAKIRSHITGAWDAILSALQRDR